ncbi:MAG: PaaI family thioesterase [Pseudomonadota bacterium]|nr:PaaI family thioesterase [Pseudomonadota bacterium]
MKQSDLDDLIDPPVPEGFEIITGKGQFTTLVGPTYSRRDPDGGATFGVRIADKHLNRRGVVHGGMLMTFMDHLLGHTVHMDVGRQATATVQLDNQFLGAVRAGNWLTGKGEIVRRTRSLVFVSGRLWVDDQAVLLSSGVWKILGA